MHRPSAFREDRTDVLHALMRRHPFATLVTQLGGEPVVSHLPMLLNGEPRPRGTLHGHLARANAEIAKDHGELSATAVFHGPHGYVSPSWYPSKLEHGRVVPTWNYAVVHARGLLQRIDDADWLRSLIRRLTDTHEARFAEPWSIDDAPADFVDGLLPGIDGLLPGIVGLSLRIESLEGKWKLSQNRPPADRDGVVAALTASDDPADRALAGLMS